MTDILAFVTAALASWRLATMLVEEEGPGRVFIRLRQKSGIGHYADDSVAYIGNTWTPLGCVLCTSLYTSLLMLVLPEKMQRVLALSGLACLIQKALKE